MFARSPTHWNTAELTAPPMVGRGRCSARYLTTTLPFMAG
jgi:hypothetical protein